MSEQKVGDTFGGSGLDSRPKVGDDRFGSAIEESDAREGAKRLEKGEAAFYAQMGMKPPKPGEPDAIIGGEDALPGAPVGRPKTEKAERRERPERRAQPPLQREEAQDDEPEGDELAAEEAPLEDADEGDEETTDEGVSPESEEAEGEEADEESSSDLDEEITVLRRARYPQSVLKKMSNAEIRRMAEIERVRQSHMDDLGRQLGEARKMESGANTSAESGSVTPPEQPAKKPPVEPLLSILGEDAAPALAEYDKTIDGRVDAVRKELSTMYVNDMLDDAREALQDRFPELLNDTFFQNTIRHEMSVLGQSKLTKLSGTTKRAKLQSLMERAVQNARAAKGLAKDRAKVPAANVRRAGTVSPPKRAVAPTKVREKDRPTAAWNMLLQGIAPKETRRRLDQRA